MPLTNDPGLIGINLYDAGDQISYGYSDQLGTMKLLEVPVIGDTIVYDRTSYKVAARKWIVFKESYGSQPYIVHLFVDRIH